MSEKKHSKDFNQKKTELISINGATSSKLELDMHDLPYAALRSAAHRFNYGRKRHGRFNWKQGDARFAEERIKHLVNHMMIFCEERTQDDLDAVICNAMMIAWYMDKGILSLDPVKDFMFDGKEK